MTFIETGVFTKLVYSYLSDEEYAALQYLLAVRPDTGDIIRAAEGSKRCVGAAPGAANAEG